MNTLVINDPNQFDEEVWQTKTDFTEKKYNDWLHGAVKELQNIYDDYEGDADVYILGDIINMLNCTKIKVKGKRKELD